MNLALYITTSTHLNFTRFWNMAARLFSYSFSHINISKLCQWCWEIRPGASFINCTYSQISAHIIRLIDFLSCCILCTHCVKLCVHHFDKYQFSCLNTHSYTHIHTFVQPQNVSYTCFDKWGLSVCVPVQSRSVGWGWGLTFVQANQVLPHQSWKTISLWTSLREWERCHVHFLLPQS